MPLFTCSGSVFCTRDWMAVIMFISSRRTPRSLYTQHRYSSQMQMLMLLKVSDLKEH